MTQQVRGCAAACATVMAMLFAAPLARADEVVELSWSAPVGCPSRASVLKEVARLVVSAPSEPLYVQATVESAASDSWSVELTMSGAVEGKRSLGAESCNAVAQAAAMIIALAVDPDSGAGQPEEEAVEAPPDTSSEDAPLGSESQDGEAEGSDSAPPQIGDQLHGILHAGVVLEGALLPKFGWGFELGGGVQWRWLRADLSFGLVPQVSASLPERAAVGGQFLLGWVGIRGCAGHDFSAIGLHACATFRPGILRGTGTGTLEDSTGAAFVPALSGGALLRFPGTSRAGLELGAGATVPLRQPVFAVESEPSSIQEALHQPSFGASFQLAFYYRL